MESSFNLKQTLCTLFAATLFAFSGCCPTTSLYPLSDPDHPVFDERLLGAWQADTGDDDQAYLHIGRGTDAYTDIQLVEHKSDGTLDTTVFKALPSSIDGDDFLSVELSFLPEAKTDDYVFIMYRLNDDRLIFLSWDEGVLENAIRDGRLKGEITEKMEEYDSVQGKKSVMKSKCVRITDSTANLVEFIKTYGKNRIFIHPVGAFKRIDGKGLAPLNTVPEPTEPRR